MNNKIRNVLENSSRLFIIVIWLTPSVSSGLVLWFLLNEPLNHFIMYFLIAFMGTWFCGWTFGGIYEGYKYIKKINKNDISYHNPKRLKVVKTKRNLKYHSGQLCIASIGSVFLIGLAIKNQNNFNLMTIIFPLAMIYNFFKVQIYKNDLKKIES